MHGLEAQLDDSNTWLCQHVEHSGKQAPPTHLRLDQTREWSPGQPTSAPRRCIRCPDCGTYWRVWVQLRIAKPSADWIAPERAVAAYRYRRAPLRDIDHVIDHVRLILTEVSVTQHEGTWPGDDDGIWWFTLPLVRARIQLESSSGMCPFFVEHDGMRSPAEGGGRNALTIEDAARMVVDYLVDEASKRGGAAR